MSGIRVERGERPDEIELIDADGNVVLLHAHGVHPDEGARTRETALKLLRGLLAPVPAVTRGSG